MRTLLVALIFFLAACPAHGSAAELTKSQFTAKFHETLKREFPKSTFTIVSELKIHSKDVDGYEMTIFLDNAYNDYLSKQATLGEVLEGRIDTLKNQKKARTSSEIGDIFPVMKPGNYLENVRKQLAGSGYGNEEPPMFYEKLNDDIYIFYVFDSPESMNFVTKGDMKKLKLGADEIRKTAISNLEKYYTSIGAYVRQLDTKGRGKIFSFEADENYEASALLTKGIWKKTTMPVDGKFVAFTPARNILLIVGGDDSIGIRIASELSAQGYAELGYSISPHGYIKEGKKWVRFTP